MLYCLEQQGLISYGNPTYMQLACKNLQRSGPVRRNIKQKALTFACDCFCRQSSQSWCLCRLLLAFAFTRDICEDTKMIIRTAAGEPHLQTLRQGGQMWCKQPADVGLPRVLAWNCNNDHVLQMPCCCGQLQTLVPCLIISPALCCSPQLSALKSPPSLLLAVSCLERWSSGLVDTAAPLHRVADM